MQDQMFVPWSIGETHINITSLFAIGSFLRKAYKTDVPTWTLIRHVYNWSAAFDSMKTDFSGISSARHFRFTKNEHGTVVMHYKTNSFDNEWRGWQYINGNDSS